ncbi:hypothetical protein SAMN04244567_00011 [Paracoccus pantotrophus]|nr:hypothetical protein SAMN04244567_00011 [Paracoccus pantotrophus]
MGGARPLWWLQKAIHLPAPVLACEPVSQACGHSFGPVAVMPSLPNDDAIVRLVGALMLETNDEWAVARRYMSLETLARVTDNPNIRLPAVAS